MAQCEIRATRFFKMGIYWEGEAPAEPFCKSCLTLGLRLGRSRAFPLRILSKSKNRETLSAGFVLQAAKEQSGRSVEKCWLSAFFFPFVACAPLWPLPLQIGLNFASA